MRVIFSDRCWVVHIRFVCVVELKFPAYFPVDYLADPVVIIIIIIVSEVKLATVVKGDQKAPFSIATTPWYRGERYSLTWITLLYP